MSQESRRFVAAVILAAGVSRRFTGVETKLLVDFHGKPLARWVLDAALASRARPVVVVTGHAREPIEAALSEPGVHFVFNENYASGLASSLRAGLAALPPEVAGAAICLADMPGVSAALIDRLIDAFRGAAPETDAVAPFCAGRRGNPVLIARRLFARVARLSGDEGAGRLLRAADANVIELPVEDAGALHDIDVAADANRLPATRN